MNLIILTDAERDRFADYLRHEAESANGLADAAKGMSPGVADHVAKKYRTEAAACMIVVGLLTGWDKMEIRGSGTADAGGVTG